MRIHHLTFRGLGPFRDEQSIDFGDLAASGLFLLEGPTGSGKSTVIDAIVFALYGQVAAGAGDKGRLVSHYLAPGVQPYVELVFETGSGIYRVRRTPAYERPAKRGKGVTQENTTVTLVRLTSPDSRDGDVLSTRVGEADAEISRAIGLSRDQFIGTVVLPQGEFASFLRAKVEDRAAILQRIFRTELYEDIQKVLDAGRKAAVKDRADADQEVKVAVGELLGAAGMPGAELPEWDGSPSSAENLAEAVQLLQDRLALSASELDATRVAASATQSTAREHLEAARKAEALQRRRRAAEDRRAELDEQTARVTSDQGQIDAADRAARVADQMRGQRDAQARWDQARAIHTRCRDAAPQDCRGMSMSELESERRGTDTLVGHLSDLVALEAALPGRRDAITNARAALDLDQAALRTVEARVAAIPVEKAALVDDLAPARAAASRVDALRTSCEALRVRAAKARELTGERAVEGRRRTAVEEAAQLAREASATLYRLRSQYYAGIAAELAGELVDDEPCPVCGSAEHPVPAMPGEGHITAEVVHDAEQEHERAATALTDAQAKLSTTQVRVAALDAVVAGLTPEQLGDELAALESEVAQAEKAQQGVTELEAASGALDREREHLQDERTGLVSRIAKAAGQIASKNEALELDSQRVEQERGSEASVGARVDALRVRSQALADLAKAAEEERESATDQARQATALGQALTREGFADADTAEAAALPTPELERLRTGVTEHARQRAVNDQELADPDLRGVDLGQVIDVEAADRELLAAEAQHEAAVKKHSVAAGQAQAASVAAAGVAGASAKRQEQWAGTEALIRISRLANADSLNVLGMKLATYVLQRRFESVVAAANEHLRQMSDGTLALVAHQEAEGRAQRGGLGLRVMDLRTDRERGIGTLSGGETFFTALSLALGLAGVVTAEAGGVALETLFVDEGFGSLDPETLDDVLGVLTSLRAGGRVVGIVSHVDELKVRIPERIEVRRDNDRGPSQLRVIA